MRKRILSLLLVIGLLVGLMPTAAFAAEPEEALYAQMLELGIVDADGTLIEDNTFTVNDGTSLSSLTELIEWLNDCGNSDLGKIVTVDATGKSATVEQLMYALLIEYQIAEVAGQLKLLASGENSVSLYSVTGAVPSYVHDMRLGMAISRDGSILTLKVCLTNKGLTGKEYTAPYDIPVEVGMFADFLAAYSEDYAADATSVVPCTNSFRTYTIPEGSSSIEFKMDLNKLRTNYLSNHEGLWDGNAYMLFQARTTVNDSGISDKMPDSTATYCVSIAPSSEADPIVNALTGGTIIGMNDDANKTVVPYRMDWSGDGTTTKIDDKDYFAFDVVTPAAKDRYNASSFGWMNYFGRALEAGVGDAKPEIKLKHVTIWTTKSNETDFPKIYAEKLDAEDPRKNEYLLIGWSPLTYPYDFDDNSTAADYVAQMTRVHLGRWDDSSTGVSDVSNDTLYKKIKNHEWRIAHFPDVEVPLTYWNEHGVGFPNNWYLNADWLENNDGTVPNEILMHGAMTIVDETAPTIKDVKALATADDFYPGNYIPIVVTFSEPVYGDYQLAYLDGKETKYLSSNSGVPAFESDVTRSGNTLSNTRVFYYYVNSTDYTGLQVLGVKPVDENACKDVYGNAFKMTANGYQEFVDEEGHAITKTLLEGQIKGGELNHSILSMTATPDAQDPNEITFRVNLYNLTQFKQDWKTWSDAGSDDPVISVRVDLGYNGVQTVNLTLAKEGTGIDEVYYLTGTMSLPVAWSDTERVAELYYDGSPLYGVYATFTQKMFVFAGMDSFTINIDGGWPSGIDNTIFEQDSSLPTLSVTDNHKDYTYKYLGYTDIYWKIVSGPDVVKLVVDGEAIDEDETLTLADADKVSIMPVKEGTAIIALHCSNNGKEETQASAWLKVTVKDSGRPTLQFPKGADSVYAQVDTDLKVTFVSTLAQHDPAEGTDGKITAELYAGSSVGENAAPIWTTTLDRKATSLTIPGEKLTSISVGDTPSYILRLTASAQVDSTDFNFSTDAKILVRARPAVIKLTGLDTPMFTDDESIKIDWTVENFDLKVNPDDCQFQFTVEKDGKTIYTDNTLSETGSYTLKPAKPEGLRDYYIVTAKAKNGTDRTWSIASSTVVVYRTGALDIQIGGETVDSVTLKNEITGGTTTTSPSGTTYSGEDIGGLTSAQAIAKLRSELSLMESIGINFDAYDWDSFLDCIKWSTTTGRGEKITDELQRAVTINYRKGTLYSPLENFSYTSYIPEVIFMLSGIRDGSNTITAQHKSIPKLSDSVTVNVETLKDKLYLFQFTPAVKTEVSYEDGLGETHTVNTNSDGSLALFEPNGIASDLRAASVSSGVSYRGTISNLALKSGEGNGTRGELYPLNTAELRRAAVAQVQLLKPDGTPLANTKVTLRGGVYRNRYIASNRDDAYCSGAMFATAAGQTASLDGKQDQTFTTDGNGMLTVHMDLSQFTSKNDPEAVGVGDSLEFIFELRFGDSYYPEIVTVNGSLNSRDAMRSGEDIVTLTAAQKAKPFVAVQSISYTGREIDVRRHTGVVGPSSNYPCAVLDSTVMLWGVADASLTDTGYYADLRAQETGVSVPRQNQMAPKDASYPFSSIPLLNNVVTLDSSSFASYDSTRKTPLEVAVYNGSNGLVSTIALPFGISDLTTIEKVEDAPSVMSLMANIAAYGTVGGANTEYGLVNTVSDGIMGDALSFMEKLGGETGLVKAILMPTADPTRYDAYLWTGINTTKLEDLEYDRNGVSLELNYFGQDYDSLLGEVNDTFTLSDFQAMADGSFFEDRSNLYGAVANGVIGLPIMLQLEGWVTTEIRYNFDKGQWEVLTTGGGFTAGAQLEYERNLNLTVYGIPLTAGFMVRGGAVVDFETSIRYAEQLGLEWSDDTANKVNDYLTALRINAYFEFFGGVGYDKGFTAKIGLFGKIDINNENRFMTRKYLKNPSDRDMAGQFLQLDGEAGIKAALGVGPVVTEITVVSLGFGTAWRFNEWDDINDYWDAASSGLGSAWLSDDTETQSLAFYSNGRAVVASAPVVKLQSRDYLEEGDRVWLGGNSGISLMSLDDPNKLDAIQTNAYPFSTPMLSDDGKILVYLSDADSTDVTDVEVRYSLSNGGSFPDDGTAIPDDGFSGYGDSSLDFDGTSGFAGAIWLREAATTGLKAGAVLDDSQQTVLLNGLEVVASIWDGSNWTTTRLTDNGSQEFEPVIAVNNGKAIAVWRSVQTDESAYSFSQNRILCKFFDGTTWSNETYTLYNGSAGEVTGMTAEMLADGTVAVAFSVNNENEGSDIYYTVVNTAAENPEDSAKTIRATTNTYTDENPQLTTVDDQFVLGWSSVQSLTGAEQHDVGLRVFDKNGTPQPVLPESLSDMVSTAAFDGQFTFVKGADALDELSILWNDANAGGEDNDVIRAIKFASYEGSYISSAPIEVAELPERTRLDHMDARVTYGSTEIQAVLQGTTYSDTEFDEISYSYELGGETYEGEGLIPKETVNLFSASEVYQNAVEVVSTTVDYTTLATNSYIPVNFTVANQGMNVINKVNIFITGGGGTTFSGLTLLPGQTKTFSVVTKTGDEIKNLGYSVEANFVDAATSSASGKVYLDYPDVGISALTVTKEQDGLRTVLANLYNQSAASLNKTNRRVVLGVYSDPACETPLNGKYFTGGTTDKPYELILTGNTLAAIDSTGYTQEINFQIGDYIKDAKLDEIPDSGVTLFVKARIEQLVNGQWITLPEVDSQNNQKHLTFDSLLTRSDHAPTTISVEMENGIVTTANVQVRNNSLQPRTSGNLVAALLDGNGNLLETKNVGDLSLKTEEVKECSIAFSKSGARVVLRYGEAESGSGTSNADAASITIDGLPLTINSFDANNSATVERVPTGQYLLTAIPEGSGAKVTVNGKLAENGMATISGGSYTRTVTVTITAADGSTTRTYTIYLNPVNYTVTFDSQGGSKVDSQTVSHGGTVTEPTAPTYEGYTFGGWYTEAGCTTEYDFTTTVTESLTLYAKWTLNTYTVTFDSQGGSKVDSQTVSHGGTVTEPTAPTYEGYTFGGWYTEAGCTTEYDFTTTVTESLTLYAKWKDVTCPTGEITVDKSKWNTFFNNITFGLFFKDTQKVTITASDNSGDNVTITYLLSDKELTVDELNASVFTAYTGAFYIEPNNEYVIYAKLTDSSGNICYINSNGVVLDNVDPLISGIIDGKTYCEAQTVTIDEKYVDSVTVDGTAVTLTDGKFTLSPADGKQTIVVTDKAGNKAEMTVTVNDGHTGGTATCTEKAKCEVCGTAYGEINANNHTDLKHIKAKAATKNAEGNIEYWYCEDCGKYFSDADAKNEITKAATVIAKLTDDTKSPQTGDNSHMVLWFALLFVSCGGIITTIYIGKRKKKKSE